MIQEVPLGVYVPGNSVLHRAPAGVKIAWLIVFILLTMVLLHTVTLVSASLVFVTALFVIARIPARTAWNQIWPVLPLLLVLGAFQWWHNSFAFAYEVVGSILVGLLAAIVVTLTTRLEDTIDAVSKGLKPLDSVGIPSAKISLAISLTLRLLPLMLATVSEVLDARKARGAHFSIRAFGVPVLVRSLKRAEKMADALIARGIDEL